jgi:glutamine synthetase
MSYENVQKLVKDNAVEFIDLRFADVRGVQHHVTFPVSILEPALFEDGKMFDGSSISGWKGINESDMILLPDVNTAVLDPFTADPTLILVCDILDPATMQAYSRDPRGVAKRAEAYLKASGIADTAFFGPEPEFFIFDSVRA